MRQISLMDSFIKKKTKNADPPTAAKDENRCVTNEPRVEVESFPE
jgi:hypothetical protein